MSDDVDDPHDVDIYASHRSASQRFVHLESAQGIARINLDRPPANVLSVEVMEELNSALESLECVESVTPILQPFKLASREVRSANTQVRIGDVVVGGRAIVVMAGPHERDPYRD